MLNGSCLCGAVNFTIATIPTMVGNCHCRMCQKQHGAPFATYMSVHESDRVFDRGSEHLKTYNSSSSIERKFCGICGSNMEWSGHPDFPNWVSIPLTLLDSHFSPSDIADYFIESKCSWV